VTLLRGALGLAAGVAGVSPMTLDLTTPGTARVTRVPFDVDAVARLRRGGFEVGAEVGFAAAVLSVAGAGFGADLRATRLEAGVRAAVTLTWWRSDRLAPFVALEAVVVPRPFDLAASGADPLGRTPYLWGGIAAGLALDLHHGRNRR
jgi:hypothetical protein